MSAEKAQSRDANPREDAGEVVGKPAYGYGGRLLEDNPDLTAAGFAGALFDEFGIPPDAATDLYDELVEDVSTDGGSATPDNGLAFDPSGFWFVELEEGNSKYPKRSWGGYSQDYGDAERVLSYDDIQKYPGDRRYGIVGIEDHDHGSMSLLIFDVDIHKAPDDFDPDRITTPPGTLIVRSQSGGLHVYFKLNGYARGDLKESDFSLTQSIPFDIDIRGSAVSMHVVAPSDIPGVGGDYTVVNNEAISAAFDPREVCEGFKLDGEQLLEYDPDTPTGEFDYDLPDDPPEEMPTCYYKGLELRKACPDDHGHTHKVNVLTGLCGLAAGYDVETVVEHFAGEWAPQDHVDRDKTEYHVKHLASKLETEYSPPALSSLREYGILDDRECCGDNCPIEWHTPDQGRRSDYYDVDLGAYVDDGDPWTDGETMLRACLRARDDGAISEHAAPPTMALLPLQRDVLEQPMTRDMSAGTKALLEDLFHELTVDELDDVLNTGGDA